MQICLEEKQKEDFINMSKLRSKRLKDADKNFTTEEFKVILNSRSQRITSSRLEILSILKVNPNPLTIAEIHDKIKTKKIDLATVYRTINLFAALNIVSEIDFKDELF